MARQRLPRTVAPPAEQAGTPVRLKIAPLTVTANKEQPLYTPDILIMWQWYGETWSDPRIGSGTWAVKDYGKWLDLVRVRLSDDWPIEEKHQFSRRLTEAMDGHRLPTLQDWDRVKRELADAPIAPTEDMAATVTAQLGGLVSHDA